MIAPGASESAVAASENRRGLLILFAVTLVLFGDLVFLPGDRVLSHASGDTALNHIYMRSYGFEEIRRGNLPLWNPMLFAGTPFLGSMQAALVYPPNVMYLVLPIQKAISIDLAGHLLLLGVFAFLWLRGWKLHWLAATYGALIVMLGGATYLRILAGQINVVATYAWAPLILLSIDRIIDRPAGQRFPSGWCLVGVAATALLVLAGYPQALFISAFCIGLYTLMRLPGCSRWPAAVAELAIVAVLPIFLSAIQLWTGIAAGMESTRSEDIPYEFASSFSFPPENLVTMLVPAFFGDLVHQAYWGRWAFWDASLFVGFGAVVFAAAGIVRGRIRLRWISFAIALITLFIAFGKYAPVHEFLFNHAPGFNRFRAPSKFLFFTAFFIATLAAIGCDYVLSGRRGFRAAAWCAAPLALVFAAIAIFLFVSDTAVDGNPWRELLVYMKTIDDNPLWFEISGQYARETAQLAAVSLGAAALGCALFGLAAWRSPTRPSMVWAAVVIAVVELVAFAMAYRSHFGHKDIDHPVLRSLDRAMLEGGRVYPVVGYDNGVSNFFVAERIPSVWGYDPLMLGRYGELMTLASVNLADAPRVREDVFTWAADPLGAAVRLGLVSATENALSVDPKLLGMLRCRLVVRPIITEKYISLLKYIRLRDFQGLSDMFAKSDNRHAVYVVPDPLPRFVMLSNYKRVKDIDEVIRELGGIEFNPLSYVVLEEEPVPAPAPTLGSVSLDIVDESTDHVTLRGTLSDPAILLMTDAYAKGWRAVPLAGSVQQQYQLLPANLALRAVPLAAGDHHFRIEYAPPAYTYALIATPIALTLYLALVAAWWLRRPRIATATSEAATPPSPETADAS